MPLSEMAVENWNDPDEFYGKIRQNPESKSIKALAFVVVDANLDGVYDTVLKGRGSEAVHRLIVQYPKHAKIFQTMPEGSLPPICGRTITSGTHHLVAFWPTTRYELLTRQGARIFPRGYFKNDIPLGEYLGSQILPLLLQKKIVRQDTVVFDHTGRNLSLGEPNYQSNSEVILTEDLPSDIQLLEELGVPIGDDSPTLSVGQAGEEIFNVGGQNYTFMELLAILHAGNASQRQQVAEFICSQTGPRFERVKQRVDCQPSTRKQKIWTQPRNVQVGEHGVDFRSQRSLNRAWEAEMAKRISRRRRLARILAQRNA